MRLFSRYSCIGSPELLYQCESLLLGPFQAILTSDVTGALWSPVAHHALY